MIQNYIDLRDKTLLVPAGLYENQTIERIEEIIKAYDKTLFDVSFKKSNSANYYIIKITTRPIEEV